MALTIFLILMVLTILLMLEILDPPRKDEDDGNGRDEGS